MISDDDGRPSFGAFMHDPWAERRWHMMLVTGAAVVVALIVGLKVVDLKLHETDGPQMDQAAASFDETH